MCRFSKLLDDPSKLGPGSYNISGDLAKSPKNVTSWKSPTNSAR